MGTESRGSPREKAGLPGKGNPAFLFTFNVNPLLGGVGQGNLAKIQNLRRVSETEGKHNEKEIFFNS